MDTISLSQNKYLFVLLNWIYRLTDNISNDKFDDSSIKNTNNKQILLNDMRFVFNILEFGNKRYKTEIKSALLYFKLTLNDILKTTMHFDKILLYNK